MHREMHFAIYFWTHGSYNDIKTKKPALQRRSSLLQGNGVGGERMIQRSFSVPAEIRELFVSQGTRRRFSAGQIMTEQDAAVRELYYIASGSVRAFYWNEEGEEITLFYLGDGNLIYLEALSNDYCAFNNSQAMTDTEVFSLPADTLLSLMSARGIPVQALFSLMMARLSLMHDYICCTHFQEISRRLAYFLHSQYVHFGPKILYTHDQIAAICGARRNAVNRALNGFAKDGLVRLGYRSIEITDDQGLVRVFGLSGEQG